MKHHQVLKKHKTVTYNKKNKLLKTNPNIGQKSELADKNIKTVTIILSYKAQKFKLKAIF